MREVGKRSAGENGDVDRVNSALTLYWKNRYAPPVGLVAVLVFYAVSVPGTVNRDAVVAWAVAGVVIIVAGLVNVHRPGFASKLAGDGLPTSVHVHAVASGVWIGATLWLDPAELASSPELLYLDCLIIVGLLLGSSQFAPLGHHATVLASSALLSAAGGLAAAGRWPLAVGAVVLLVINARATLDSASIYSELATLRVESQRQAQAATVRANHDPLTGLLNRRGLSEWLEATVELPTYCMFIDLDHFKVLNDTFGHEAGDLALVRVGECVRGAVGDRGVSARVGGDEFMAVLTCDVPVEHARELAASLLLDLRRPVHEHPEMTLSASIGVVPARGENSLQILLARSDVALYEAKQGGRSRVVIADR